MNLWKLDNPTANIFLAKRKSEGAIRDPTNQKNILGWQIQKVQRMKNLQNRPWPLWAHGPGPIWAQMAHLGPNWPKNIPKIPENLSVVYLPYKILKQIQNSLEIVLW